MRTLASEVQAICNNAIRTQWAAGGEMLKTARIVMRRGMRQQQETGLKELNKLLQDIRAAKDRESVVKKTGIATGYANAMRHFELISANELNDVIEVIGQAGERATSRIESASRPFLVMNYQKAGAGMSAQEYRRIVAVDFDGTLAVTKYPEIIKPIPKMIRYCKRLQKGGAILILYTCRKGKELQDAVEWCEGQGLVFDYINENTAENIASYGGIDTRKIFAHEYIDDKAINPVREAMWARRVRQLYASRIISAAGIAAALVGVIEAVLAAIKYFA